MQRRASVTFLMRSPSKNTQQQLSVPHAISSNGEGRGFADIVACQQPRHIDCVGIKCTTGRDRNRCALIIIIKMTMKSQSFRMRKPSFLAFLLHAAVSTSRCKAGWVDPDTPEEFLSTTSHFEEDTREYELVSCAGLYPYYFFPRTCI